VAQNEGALRAPAGGGWRSLPPVAQRLAQAAAERGGRLDGMVPADRAKHRKGSGAHHEQQATGKRNRWWRSGYRRTPTCGSRNAADGSVLVNEDYLFKLSNRGGFCVLEDSGP
jgi:hypothetical protein